MSFQYKSFYQPQRKLNLTVKFVDFTKTYNNLHENILSVNLL